MVAELIWEKDGRRVTCPLGEFTLLGRGLNAHVQVMDLAASKTHAAIRREDSGYVVEDLGSKNGTYLNGNKVRKAFLKPRDTIAIGDALFVFQSANESPTKSTIEEEVAEKSIVLHEVEAPGPDSSGKINCEITLTDVQREDEVLDTLRHRLEILQNLCELTARSEDMNSLVRGGVESLMTAFPHASRCCVMLGHGEPSDMRTEYEEVRNVRSPGKPSRSVLNYVLNGSKAVLSRNVRVDARFDTSMSLADTGTKSIMCSPMWMRDRLSGAVYIESLSEHKSFTREDLQLLATVTADLAIGIDNALLRDERIKMERLAAVGQAIAGMAHCIKNVLNNMNFGSYIVDQGLSKRETPLIEKGWGLIKSGNLFMHDMVLNMLAYSKPREPVYKNVDLSQVLHNAWESCRQYAESRGVTLSFERASRPVMAEVDEVSMERCLYNLVGNAIEACENAKNPQVVLLVEPAGEEACRIIVQDNGCGMPPEVKERIFQAFFSTKGSRGTGLGLAVVAKIIEEHHGKVMVDSEVGCGTTFTLELPLHPPLPSRDRQAEQKLENAPTKADP